MTSQLLDHWRAALRQRRYHREFRIDAPVWDEARWTRVVQAVATLAAACAEPVTETPDGPTEGALPDSGLATAATNIWRARRRLDSGVDNAPNQAARYLRTCVDTLKDAGLVIQDHDGDRFHPGQALEVLLYQEDPSSSVETVAETVRPSVFLNGRRIQMGQVIVNHPPETPEEAGHA